MSQENPTREADLSSAGGDAAGGGSEPPVSHASPQATLLVSPQTPKWVVETEDGEVHGQVTLRWPQSPRSWSSLAAGTKTPLSAQEQLLIMIS